VVLCPEHRDRGAFRGGRYTVRTDLNVVTREAVRKLERLFSIENCRRHDVVMARVVVRL
jgi:hypothetical protein